MPRKRKIDNAALLKMISDGVIQSEIMKKFGFKSSPQLKTAYANALMESGKAPEIKGQGRTGKGKDKPVKTEISVNARGSLVIPKALVEHLKIPEGQAFEVKQTASGSLQLKKVEIQK